jgi:hypothetical protein
MLTMQVSHGADMPLILYDYRQIHLYVLFTVQQPDWRETVRNPTVYDSAPWGEECFTQHRRVPQYFPYRLADPLSLQEVKRAISRMKNRKAPGMNGVGAELWKHAPDWMVEELRKQINSVLEGGPMPPQ